MGEGSAGGKLNRRKEGECKHQRAQESILTEVGGQNQ